MDPAVQFADDRLAARRDQLTALVLPCVRLHSSPTDEAAVAIGASKIGGRPDVPDSFEWPRWNGLPMGFLAQIDLGDLASFAPAAVLPRSGLLSFFYDARQRTWGFDPQDRGSWSVLHFPDRQDLARCSFPDDLPDDARYRACGVEFREGLTVAPYESPGIRQLGLSDEEADAYWNVTEKLGEGHEGQPVHQLMGHAEPVQGDMHLECQLASNGLYCGDSTGYRDPRRRALESGAVQWRLLLQLDSDDNAAMMWGDMGRLYFWIREEDLAKQDFARAWMILQCG